MSGNGSEAPPILTEAIDGVLVITLNRPQARNAVNQALADALASALDELDSDDDLRAGVLTGAGKGFCAGMDLKALVRGERSIVDGRGWAGMTMRPPDKPLIAAVEGFALAGGFEIALACDLIVAARGAQFGIPEVKRGLIAAAGGLQRLPKRLPYHLAMQLAITGEPISAERAHELGLVNELCEPGEARTRACALAHGIASNAPLAVRASKAVVRDALDWSEEEGWHRIAEIAPPLIASADAMEGAIAFAEKRAPVWKGR